MKIEQEVYGLKGGSYNFCAEDIIGESGRKDEEECEVTEKDHD